MQNINILLDVNIIGELNGKFKKISDLLNNNKYKKFFYYGGTKFKAELKKTKSFLDYLFELSKTNHFYFIELDENEINIDQERIEIILCSTKKDDPHIVAIVNTTHKKIFRGNRKILVVTSDERSNKVLKDKRLYDKVNYRPKIYSLGKHDEIINKCSY